MNNFFNIQRFINLLKRQFILNSKSIFIGLGAASGILFLIFTIVASTQGKCLYNEQVSSMYNVYFIAGYIISSRLFKELSDSRTGYLYLTLPASNFEKLLAGWLYSSVLYSIVSVVLIIIITSLANFIASLIIGFEFTPFNYDFKYIMLAVGVYMITQSVFILGSATFKKQAFLKTLLALFIFAVSFSLITGFLTWGIVGKFNIHMEPTDFKHLPPGLEYFFEVQFPVIAKIVFWYLTAPFILLISYFKLKESEV